MQKYLLQSQIFEIQATFKLKSSLKDMIVSPPFHIIGYGKLNLHITSSTVTINFPCTMQM